MLSKKWKRFSSLTGKCYNNMVGAEKDGSCWAQAFELLKEIICEERQKNPDFAPQLEMIDDVTDYEYDIQGWLEDCLDELDMRGEYEALLRMTDDLLGMFSWPEYTDSDIKFDKSSALGSLGRNEEAVKFCESWIKEEPDNIVAAAAGVYAYIRTKEYDAAQDLVDRFISDKSKCGDEDSIMFVAASKLYEATGTKKEKKQIDKALQDYDKYLEDYFENLDLEDEGFGFSDGELPFN